MTNRRGQISLVGFHPTSGPSAARHNASDARSKSEFAPAEASTHRLLPQLAPFLYSSAHQAARERAFSLATRSMRVPLGRRTPRLGRLASQPEPVVVPTTAPQDTIAARVAERTCAPSIRQIPVLHPLPHVTCHIHAPTRILNREWRETSEQREKLAASPRPLSRNPCTFAAFAFQPVTDAHACPARLSDALFPPFRCRS